MDGDEKVMREQRKLGIAGMFGRAAAIYDRMGPRFFSYFGQRMVDLSQLRAGARVLDVAMGRGAALFPAVKQIGSQGYAVGIDLADEMVQKTTEDAHRLGLENVEIRKMDAENLEFPDEYFDYILCGFSIFFFQLDRALSEFYRVLRPGGHVTVTTWGRDDERWSWLGELGKKYMQHMPPQIQAAMAERERNAQAQPLNRSEGLREVFSNAGFVNIQVIDEGPEFTYSDEDEWLAVQMSHGMRFVFEMLPPPILEDYKADAIEYLRAMKRPDGIPHTLFALYTLAEKPLE